MKPLIGISCDEETITDSRGIPARRLLVGSEYIEAVRLAGGEPILLPHTAASAAVDMIKRLDGLLLSGGDFDVPPEYYGESSHPKLGGLARERSESEKALLLEALTQDMPVLGVCGGMQLINVVLGGSLWQDLSLRENTQIHIQPKDKHIPFHSITLEEGSRLAGFMQTLHPMVNSTHHQLIKIVSDELVAVAHSKDGVVEAIESSSKRFLLGIQWHPESLADGSNLAIYEAFVGACRVRSFSVGGAI